MTNFFAPKEETPEVVNEAVEVEETYSKEDVDSIMNAAKESAESLTKANDEIVNAKDEEIAKLKADLEKATNTATVVEGEDASPESEDKKEAPVNAFIAKTAARLNNKFNIK